MATPRSRRSSTLRECFATNATVRSPAWLVTSSPPRRSRGPRGAERGSDRPRQDVLSAHRMSFTAVLEVPAAICARSGHDRRRGRAPLPPTATPRRLSQLALRCGGLARHQLRVFGGDPRTRPRDLRSASPRFWTGKSDLVAPPDRLYLGARVSVSIGAMRPRQGFLKPGSTLRLNT